MSKIYSLFSFRVVDTIAKTFLQGIQGVSHCAVNNKGISSESKLSHAAMMVALSCCKVPQNLGEVFDATKKVLIGFFCVEANQQVKVSVGHNKLWL